MEYKSVDTFSVPEYNSDSNFAAKEQSTVNANPILLQRKFTRVVEAFAQIAGLSLSDMYLAEELLDEYRKEN